MDTVGSTVASAASQQELFPSSHFSHSRTISERSWTWKKFSFLTHDGVWDKTKSNCHFLFISDSHRDVDSPVQQVANIRGSVPPPVRPPPALYLTTHPSSEIRNRSVLNSWTLTFDLSALGQSIFSHSSSREILRDFSSTDLGLRLA